MATSNLTSQNYEIYTHPMNRHELAKAAKVNHDRIVAERRGEDEGRRRELEEKQLAESRKAIAEAISLANKHIFVAVGNGLSGDVIYSMAPKYVLERMTDADGELPAEFNLEVFDAVVTHCQQMGLFVRKETVDLYGGAAYPIRRIFVNWGYEE